MLAQAIEAEVAEFLARHADQRNAPGLSAGTISRLKAVWQEEHARWQKRRLVGAGVPELKRLRELEAENPELKRMYADLALENSAIKEVLNRKL